MTEEERIRQRLEERRYAVLQQAFHKGDVKAYVDFRKHNNGHSPAYNPWENIVPFLFMILFSLAILIFHSIEYGMIALVLSIFVYVVILRPWVAQRVTTRVRVLLERDVITFKLLWLAGGVSLTFNDRGSQAVVSAPSGDWAHFVRHHLVTATETGAAPETKNDPAIAALPAVPDSGIPSLVPTETADSTLSPAPQIPGVSAAQSPQTPEARTVQTSLQS